MAHRATKQQEVYFYIFYTYLISLWGPLQDGNTYGWRHNEILQAFCTAAALVPWDGLGPENYAVYIDVTQQWLSL